MTLNWQGIFTALGGEAVFLAAVGWLVKSLISNRLLQETEAFKANLKADTDAQTARLKSSLQIAALEHQVRFSKLHERRAEVIAELYKQLRETHWAVRTFVYGDPQNLASEESANEKLVNLYRYAEVNRLYLPEAECILLDKVVGELRKSHIFVRTYSYIQNPTPQTVQERRDVMVKVSETLETHIPGLTSMLEKEFRALLGVTNKDKSGVVPSHGDA